MTEKHTGPNGAVVHIAAGRYSAALASSGAMLGHVRLDGRDLVVPVDLEAALPVAYQGKTLVPWPNRITGARYVYDGTAYEVPINEHETGAALHGLACWEDWRIAECDESAVTFSLDILPSYGYPFSLHVTSTYSLDAESGLEARVTATNTGTTTAPYGASSHPYLTCGGVIDDCLLTLPAGKVMQVNDHLAPDRLEDVSAAGVDFRGGRMVGGQFVDNAFTDLPGGSWDVRLERPGDCAVVMTSGAPWVQFFSGDHLGRAGAAIEPMTCAPDAFNSGDGLIALAPGETHSFEWALRGEL